MNDYILKYIKQRMLEMGFGLDYTFESILVTVEDGGGSECAPIAAYNEYYFLVSKVLPAIGLNYIKGDTTILTVNEIVSYSNYSLFGIQEFTGNIIVDNQTGASIELEFVRVIPRIKRSEEEAKYTQEYFLNEH